MSKTKLAAVVVAGGQGSRMQSAIAKQFLVLKKQPVLVHTLNKFYKAGVEQLVLVLPQHQIEYWKELCQQYSFDLKHTLVAGGETRFHSVQNGLKLINADSLVAIHDGVRPLVSLQIIADCYANAQSKGSGIAAVKLKDSIRQEIAGGITASRDRSEYWLIQTPQTFKASEIIMAYQQTYQSCFTDCASVAEAYGLAVHLVEGDYKNIKITTPEDLPIAELLIQ